MKVAVTGASGFLGSAVLRSLSRSGHVPVAISRTMAHGAAIDCEVRASGDLLTADLGRLFSGCDAVINTAARVHVTQREEAEVARRAFHAMNVELLARMAQAAADSGVRRFVQISSVAAITSSSARYEPISDHHPEQPMTPYGQSKALGDRRLGAIQSSSLSVVMLRPPTIYGPGVGAFFAMLMRAARYGVPLPIGRIDNLRSFAYVDNVADAAARAAEGVAGGAYIVTDSPPMSTADLYRKLLALYGHSDRVWNWPTSIVAASAKLLLRARADSLIGNAAYDGRRFADAFDWTPAVDTDSALRETIAGA